MMIIYIDEKKVASDFLPRRAARPAFLTCPLLGHWTTAAPPRAIPSSSSSSPALIASVQDLYDFICCGPLVDRIGYTSEKIAESIDRWLLAGARVARLFRLNELQLSDAEKARIYHFYIPVFLWCEDEVMVHRARYNDGDDIPPLVVRTFHVMPWSKFAPPPTPMSVTTS
jgi:D-glycerate 3-kinase